MLASLGLASSVILRVGPVEASERRSRAAAEALEHGARPPLGALVTLAEERRVPKQLRRWLTWGERGRSALVPTGLIDFGLRPSVGLYLTSDGWLYRGNSLRLHLATGGVGWYRVSGSTRHRPGVTRAPALELHGEVERRTDPLFWGVGPRVRDVERRRDARTLAEAHVGLRLEPGRQRRVEGWLGLRRAGFDDASGEGFVDSLAAPDGFGGDLFARVGLRGSLDSRPRGLRALPSESDVVEPAGSGVRLGARVELAGGPRFDNALGASRGPQALVRRGVVMDASLDLVRRRVLTVRFTFDTVNPLLARGDPLPVTELATLGGQSPMRGVRPRRLLGRFALAATLEHARRVRMWLDGIERYALGNAFGPALDGALLGALRQSFGIGLRTTLGGEHRFELLLAAGTRPFDEGGEPESLHFVVGSALDL
ncbi:MAG: hypothetical protein FJ095_11745 [Deltaproteobacteria bacterium]|nr:hypothetical protein [Deltaproteobacteria bacterium]